MLKTPVALIVFNRPITTEKVFEAIRNARPQKLLVIADGARENRDGEVERCKDARAIIDRVDWPCEVLRNYSTENMGCRKRVSSGLDWVFNQVEEAIILEDDCLPHPTFFRFCEEMLEYYRGDDRVAMISGDNFQLGANRNAHSYYFSRYCHIWGWATWRRAWQNYDVEMKTWPELKNKKWLKSVLSGEQQQVSYWSRIFRKVHRGEIDTWDYQWFFACLKQGGMSVVPKANLVSNIGFGDDATHIKEKNLNSDMAVTEMEFPLSHPPTIVRNESADEVVVRIFFTRPSWLDKRLNKIKNLLIYQLIN